jgi:3-deoxy-D-manno-octulosonic-acid transferase
VIAAQVVYNVLLTALAVPTLPFAGAALVLRPRYRLGLSQRLGFAPTEVRQRLQGQHPVWVHAPSVGEILATRPFLQELKQVFPDTPILLSALTPTAYTAAREKISEADAVMYFPLDHPLFIAHVLRRITPRVFFFTETEMWPNFLLALAHRHIPTFLVSGRFSARALARYRHLSPLFCTVFRSLTRCCMQTAADADRLIAAGAPEAQVAVTGNFKMDCASEGGTQGLTVLRELGLADRPLLIGASTHPGEEEFLLRVFRRLRAEIPPLLLLLAPRHPQRFAEVEQLLAREHCRYVKRSQDGVTTSQQTEVFLLDTLGELASFYRAATVTFVGGSLVKGPGGHSVIEPALARTPVCCGPYAWNFATIVEQLVHTGGGCVVRTEEECYARLRPFFLDPQKAQEAGGYAYKVMKQGQGAVKRTVAVIMDALQQRQALAFVFLPFVFYSFLPALCP